ncbi:acyltransferase [Cellulosimicrobium marinum]|uniref:acyltransferase n=1 Tax=Cellulosimicrobium marinum TaxID=1638992 RepID=UPI001E487D1E|nr:acyltransferase [Cellulosimicrobium marinum]MCB7135441.1 acyltransferase [Cellulosimicrobium marinum]
MARSRRRETLVALANVPLLRRATRLRVLRRAGVTFEGDADVATGFFVSHDGPLTIGDGTWINHHVYVDTAAEVRIGAGVGIADHVRILTATHDVGPRASRGGPWVTAPVTIGDGCWVGSGVTILPGVTVAPGCVLGAGAVVTADTEPDGLYVGVPARRVRDLDGDAAPVTA